MNVIKIFFAGDFCSKPSTSRIVVSDELRDIILSCNFKVVNFEVPLKPDNITLPPQKRERFFQHNDAPNFLRKLGFNLFQLANNHAFDWGEEGFKKTKNNLGDAAFGAGTYNEAYKVKIVEANGVKFGFLALCFAAYKGVFDDVKNHEGLGCAYINDLKVNHIILEAKQQVDYLFVLPHDGIEYIDIPIPETIARYRDFIDWGADAVIGSHPHCPQGWETYNGKPIFYSLGNFLFNSKEGYDYRAWNRPHWYEGLCVVFIIDTVTHEVSYKTINTRNVDNLGIIIDNNPERENHNKEINSYLNNRDKYYDYLHTICDNLGKRELAIIDKTLHPYTLKKCTKLILQCWINKLRGRNFTDDKSLQWLLKNDTRRKLMERLLKLPST